MTRKQEIELDIQDYKYKKFNAEAEIKDIDKKIEIMLKRKADLQYFSKQIPHVIKGFEILLERAEKEEEVGSR